MKIISVIPAATASSTAYWMSGLSTTGIISFALALVAGRKRVPIPATGKTALVTVFMRRYPDRCARVGRCGAPGTALLEPADDGWKLFSEQVKQVLFLQHGDAELPRLLELA